MAGNVGFMSSLKGLGISIDRIPSTHVLGYDCAALRAVAKGQDLLSEFSTIADLSEIVTEGK